MERYTKEQRVIVVKTHYKYGESYAETFRKIRGIFGRRNAPNQSTVQRIIKKFEETGSIMNSKTHAHARAHTHTHTFMRKCHREFHQKRKSVPAELWGTFVGYCVPQLITVCVLYTEIKISTLFE